MSSVRFLQYSSGRNADSTQVAESRTSKSCCRNYKILDSESRTILCVFSVLTLISASVVAIGAMQFFGPLGSGGFNISVGAGSLMGLIFLGGIAYKIRKQCKQKDSNISDFYDTSFPYNSVPLMSDPDHQSKALGLAKQSSSEQLKPNEEEPILGYPIDDV